jgi:hypothetical protein
MLKHGVLPITVVPLSSIVDFYHSRHSREKQKYKTHMSMWVYLKRMTLSKVIDSKFPLICAISAAEIQN